MWFVKKEHLNELSEVSTIEGAFLQLDQMIQNDKAVKASNLGKTTMGLEFNRKMMNNPNYETVYFNFE